MRAIQLRNRYPGNVLQEKSQRLCRPNLESLEPRLALAAAVGVASNSLISFDTATPGTITSTPSITGLVAGDTIVAIDFRPATGQLYGLGVNGTTAHLYTLNTATAVATQLGGNFTLPESVGASGPETDFGFDFNPVPDRIRVVANNRDNFRLNPNNGTLIAVDIVLNPGTPTVAGAAYTNNFSGATSTTLYVIDFTTNQLLIQNPPNSGTLTPVGAGLGVDVTAEIGFDIATVGGVNQAFAALRVGGVPGLYTIDLATGTATLVGSIGGGISLRDLAINTGQFDFGDAPESYGTLLSSDGARS